MSSINEALERPQERKLTQLDLMIEQAMRVEGLSGAERLALIDKIEGIYLRRKQEEAEELFNAALRDAQAEMEQIPAESFNPQTRSHYAKYAAVDKKIRPIYTEHGFALFFRQGEGAPADHIRLICRVSHKGGHVEHPFLDLPADGKGAKGGDVMSKTHATGAGVSYGKRYLAGMIFNLAFIDDKDDNDGNAIQTTVTEAQAQQLKDEHAKLNQFRQGKATEAFKLRYKVDSFEELPAKKFADAMNWLRAAVRKEGADATINDDQEATLTAKLDELGTKHKNDFLKANNIRTVGDLPASQYQGALAALERLRRKG